MGEHPQVALPIECNISVPQVHAFRESKEANLFGFTESVLLFHFHPMPFDDILILWLAPQVRTGIHRARPGNRGYHWLSVSNAG